MKATDVSGIARQFFEQYGAKAMAIAAKRAQAADEKGNAEEAQTWRRIEECVGAMRGAPSS
ncbi:MAG: hypothetical protein GC199_00930 [Alphaproteobacteria bacterium]|nr:hypothetical protein [Alphaproteobacteria bacterium]